MIGQYIGPRPEDCSAYIEKAEQLRLNATDINKYITDFVELWNSMPEVLKIHKWEWVTDQGASRPMLDLKTRNSHSCPDGGVQNFTGSADKATAYPAIRGRLEILFDYRVGSYGVPTKESSPDIPRLNGYFGSGNGVWSTGMLNYGYSSYVTFWLQDFPAMFKEYEKIEDKISLQNLWPSELAAVFCPLEDAARYVNHDNQIVARSVADRLGE